MADIFDYLKWRGDLSVTASPLCDVDRLIFAELAYIDFDITEPIPLSEACKKQLKRIEVVRDSGAKWEKLLHHKLDEELMMAVMKCHRFSEMNIGYCENKLDREVGEQFAAMTVFLPDSTAVVVFRGTDWSLVGWKEDLTMTYCDELPAQKSAANYLEKIAGITDGKIEITGHSKGGNLAVYAGTFSSEDILERVVRITNLDGPGFNERVVQSERYDSIIERVFSILPRSSIVGALFSSKGNYRVIASRGAGPIQHIPYNWEVMGGDFVDAERDVNGQKVNNALNRWIVSLENEDRKRFIETIWSLIDKDDIIELGDLIDGKTTKEFIKKYRSLDAESRAFIKDTLARLRTFAKDEFSNKKKT